MSVREFDGTDDVIDVTGTGFQFFNGAFSLVTIVKPLTIAAEGYMNFRASSSWAGGLEGDSDRLRMYNPVGNSIVSAFSVITVDWQIAAMTKVSGSVQGTAHIKPLGSGVWQHNVGGDTFGNDATSVTGMRFGNADTGNFRDMRLAVVALFTTELTSGNVESLQTTASTQQLATLGAVHIWEFNQASTATAVTDLVGDWDQSAITGTSVAGSDDPPGWTFGLEETFTAGGHGVIRPTRHRGRYPARDSWA